MLRLMSHMPDGINEETKYKLHQTLLFTFSYNYKSTGIIDCIDSCKHFRH